MHNDVVHSTVIKTQEASGLLLQKGGAPVHEVKKFLNPRCQNLKLHSQTLTLLSTQAQLGCSDVKVKVQFLRA